MALSYSLVWYWAKVAMGLNTVRSACKNVNIRLNIYTWASVTWHAVEDVRYGPLVEHALLGRRIPTCPTAFRVLVCATIIDVPVVPRTAVVIMPIPEPIALRMPA
jgi:hypothetical protein